jgi:hypothetical protein
MIDAYVAYSIMLLPFLSLLLVTPLWRKGLELMLTLMFWTCLLRILDVITYHLWVIYYQRAMATALGSVGIGIQTMLQMPSATNQCRGPWYFSTSGGVWPKLFATPMAKVICQFRAYRGQGIFPLSSRGTNLMTVSCAKPFSARSCYDTKEHPYERFCRSSLSLAKGPEQL